MDPRFDLPIFTRAETSTHLGLSPSTLGYWLRTGALDATEARPGEASMTFASVVEAHMLRQLRDAGSRSRRSGTPPSGCEAMRDDRIRSPGGGSPTTAGIC